MSTDADRDLPAPKEFAQRYGPNVPRSARILALHKLLQTGPGPDEGRDTALAWLQRLAAWLLAGRSSELADLRLAALVRALRDHPHLAAAAAGRLRAVLEDGRSARLFASTGLPAKPGLFAETSRRLVGHLLPEPPLDGDLAQILTLLFPDPRSGALLAELDPTQVDELFEALGHPLEPLAEGIPEALLLLAHRVAAHGLSDDFLERAIEPSIARSPFAALPRACEAHGGASAEALDGTLGACLEAVERCRDTAKRVHAHLESTGVSIDLVYRLQVIESGLARIERLARLHGAAAPRAEAGAPRARAALDLASSLAVGAQQERSLRSLARSNVQLLSRKIVEHSGETGDHYITSTRAEYVKMLASAGGGGVLTAGTTVAKFWIAGAKLPLLIEAAASSLNYAGSFVTMQLMGFTLATKQPSATGAALAKALGKIRSSGQLTAWSQVVARITRSQLAAAAGNLGLVVPVALGIDLLLRTSGGGPLLDEEQSRYAIDSLHPLSSATLAYAALTGVLLWLSSVIAGAAQNWSAYRRLPESFASISWIRKLAGDARAAKLQAFVERNIAGFGGNVSLGLLLAMVPLFGKLTGLPLDVRHVTLSTGSLAFAAGSLGWSAVLSPEFAGAIVGIGCIALLNFGVSFALALWVALRAEEIGRTKRRRLLMALLTKLRREPLDFIRPPREPAAPASDDTGRAPPGASLEATPDP